MSKLEKIDSTPLGSTFAAHSEALPPAFIQHETFRELITAVDRFDPDLGMFFQYYEWNLRNNTLDFSLVLPMFLFSNIRLAMPATTNAMLSCIDDYTSMPSQALQSLVKKIETQDVKDPLLPRAISLSFERLSATISELNFVFIDFDELVELEANPNLLSEIFESFGQSIHPCSSSLELLQDICDQSFLAHCGVGRRNNATRFKVYLEGTLPEFINSKAGRECSHLFGKRQQELEEFAQILDDRLCHMVIDVCDAQVIRVGFELNIDPRLRDNYGTVVLDTAMWNRYSNLENSESLHQLIVNRRHKINHPDGNESELFISHFKISFDGSDTPEWKVYFSCTKEF